MIIANIIFFAALAAFLAIPGFLAHFLRPRPAPRTLWLQLACLYCGFLSLLAAVGFGTVALLGDAFHRGLYQLFSWLAVVLSLLVGAILTLLWGYTAKVVVTDTGLEQYGPFTRRTLPWHTIDRVAYVSRAGMRIMSGNRRRLTIPLGSGDTPYFLAECRRHNIPVSGLKLSAPDGA